MFRALWERTKRVAATYTWTFVVVMLLNQLVFFGFCLNPICLIAAMPHVLLITVVLGSLFNKFGRGGQGATEESQQAPSPPNTSVSKKVENALDAIQSGLEKFSKSLDASVIGMQVWSVYDTEKCFVDSKLRSSIQKLEVQQRSENDPEFGRIYNELLAKMDQNGDDKSNIEEADAESREVASFILPAEYQTAENLEEIKAKIAKTEANHFQFLMETKKKLDRDPDLMAIFEAEMQATGGAKILAHIKALQPESHSARKLAVVAPRRVTPKIHLEQRPPSKRADLGNLVTKNKAKAELRGAKAHRLDGNWRGGFACDIHTLSSKHLGVDEHGHDVWDNTRSEMGQHIYQLKYSGDFSVVPQIIDRLCEVISIDGFDCIIPVPASKKRKLQPVDAIAQALGKRCSIPVMAGFLGKTGNLELKGVGDPVQRAEALAASIGLLGQDDISGRNVLLVDDLYRSGATLNACSRVLRDDAKVGEIWVLTMTKTRRHK